MEKSEIVSAILSRDSNKLSEAKAAIKSLLDDRAAQFRADTTKFVAKSLFEETETVEETGVGEGVVASPEEQISDHDYDPNVNLKKPQTPE